jgi:AmpD protein
MQIEQGWLDAATRLQSANTDARPDPADISLLVVHNISLPPEQFGGPYIGQFFCNCLDPDEHPYFAEIAHLKVSSHLLIDRLGNIIQFVPFGQRAWHAGVSQFEGRDNCNDFSIGIELEGADNIAYTERQYIVLTEVTKVLCNRYPLITADRIQGHSDIAPGRKTDPGPAFDWGHYRSALI